MTIPDSVESIDDYALADCANLEAIDIASSSVTRIGINAFANTESLGSVDLPGTLTVISDCKLASHPYLSTQHARERARAHATLHTHTRASACRSVR